MSSAAEYKRRQAERRRTIEAAQAADRRETNRDVTRRGSDASTPNRDSTRTRGKS